MTDPQTGKVNVLHRRISPFALAAAFFILLAPFSPLKANIYSWTDRNGVKHFSNVPPPPSMDAAISVRQEVAYDRDADEKRWDLDQKEWESIKQDLIEAEEQTIRENYGADTENVSKSLEDKIEQEKFRLELEISRLRKLPVVRREGWQLR